MDLTNITIPVSSTLAQQLPSDPVVQAEILTIGLKQWRIRQALETYKQGAGTLAYAAQQAGVSVREIIPLAYSYGLTPKIDSDWPLEDLSLDEAEQL